MRKIATTGLWLSVSQTSLSATAARSLTAAASSRLTQISDDLRGFGQIVPSASTRSGGRTAGRCQRVEEHLQEVEHRTVG